LIKKFKSYWWACRAIDVVELSAAVTIAETTVQGLAEQFAPSVNIELPKIDLWYKGGTQDRSPCWTVHEREYSFGWSKL